MGSSDILKVRLTAEGVQDVVNALKKVEGAASKTKKTAEGIGSTLRSELRDLGVAVAVQQMAAFVKANIDAQASVQDMVEVTGASAEAISVLGMAAAREGVAMEALGKGTRAFTKFIAEVQSGAPEASKSLADLGLNAKDLVGKSLDQQLIILADAFNTFSDEGQSGLNKTAVAMKVFGKQGENMRQVLQQLSGDGFAKLRVEGEKTGQVLSGQAAQAAKEAKVEMAKLEGQIQGVTNAFAQGLIPELVSLGESFTMSDDKGQGFFRTLGGWVGNIVKGVAGAFQIVGKAMGAIGAEALSHLEETADKAGLYWDAIFGKTKIKEVPALFDKMSADFARLRANQREEAKKDFWGGLEKLFPGQTPSTTGQDPAVSAAAKAEEERKKKQLQLADAATQKAMAAARTAAAKRQADDIKAQLDAYLALTEDLYKQGLIDLGTYLMARRTAIEQGTAAEVAVLQAQIRAEIASRTKGMATSDRIASDTKVADLRAQITQRQKQGEEQLNALERKGRDEREAAALEALKLEGDLEQAKGRTGAAAIKAIQAEYNERIRLAKTPEAKAALTGMRDTAVSKAKVDEAGKMAGLAQGGLQMSMTGIDQQREAGLISEAQAVDLRTQAYEKWIPIMQEAALLQLQAAQAVGDPALVQAAEKQLQDLDGMKIKLANMKDQLKEFKDAARDAFIDGFANFLETLADKTSSLTDKMKALGFSIAQAVLKLAAMKVAQAAAGAMGFAGGGPIFGPGTSTSDSIPIMASAGEFMVRAAAVRHYGLDTLAALNGMRLPKGTVRGYADGGPIAPSLQPIPVRGDFSHSMQIGLDEGLLLRALDSPEGAKVILKQTTANSKKFNRALGR